MLSSTSYATNAPGLALLDAVALVQGHVARFADVKAHFLEGRRAHGGVHNVGEAVAHLNGGKRKMTSEQRRNAMTNSERMSSSSEQASMHLGVTVFIYTFNFVRQTAYS